MTRCEITSQNTWENLTPVSIDPSMSDPSTEPARDEHAPAIPPAPRAITARARARSWHEKSVRIWMILALIVAGTTIYFAIRDTAIARHERWLMFEGKLVKAT